MSIGKRIVGIETEKRRLHILTALEDVPGYELAALFLKHRCIDHGIPTSSDQMEQALAWLEQAELVTVRAAAGSMVARINARGREVALGLVRIPGILPPDP